MKTEPGVKVLNFAAAANGSVLMTSMRGQKIVQGIKATYAGPEGAETAFFVTIGPFFDEHGLRPIVYPLDDIATDLVIDATAQTRLTYDLDPATISMKKAEDGTGAGELLLSGTGQFLAVANFGHAGSADLTYLDLESGALSDLPDMPYCFSLSRWRVETLGPEGDVSAAHEFSLPG